MNAKKPKTAAVVSTKGGAGKTTTTVNIAAICADAGLRVLLIDTDPQPTASSYLELTHEAPGGFFELIARNETDLSKIVSKTVIDNLDLIISNDPYLELANMMLQAPDGRIRLKNLSHIFSEYDLVILDTAGARTSIVEMAIVAADLVISPIPPHMLAAREFHRGTRQIFSDLKPYENLGIKLPPCKIVINMLDRTNDARLISETIRTSFADDQFTVMEATVPTAISFRDAATQAIPLHRFEYRNPGNRESGSALDFMRALAIELFPEWEDKLTALTKDVVANLARGGK